MRSDLGRTVNFILPSYWENSSPQQSIGVRFTVEVYWKNSASGRVETLARTTSPSLTFYPRRELNIRYVTIDYQPKTGSGSTPSATIINSPVSRLMQRVFPAAVINYQSWAAGRSFFVSDLPFVYNSDQYSDLKRELNTQLVSVGDTTSILVGWLPGNVNIYPSFNSRFVWYGVSGTDDRSPLVVANALAWRTLPHEIGHTLGKGHSPCEVDEWIDWPYAQGNANIQEYGLDVTDLSLVDKTAPDFMSYCGDGFTRAGGAAKSWVSPYTYQTLFNSHFLQPQRSPGRVRTQGQSQAASQDVLLVSGLVYRDGRVKFAPFYHIQAPPSLPPAGSGYCLEFQGSTGRSLASYCFDLSFLDSHTQQPTNIASFAWGLPYPAGTNRLVLKQGSKVLGRVTVSAHVPTITVTSPRAGQSWSGLQTLTWTASDADNNQLTFRAFYSADNGQSWQPLSGDLTVTRYTVDTNQLPGGNNARIRILASDGINTGVAEVGSLNVPRKAPKVTIVAPNSGVNVRSKAPLLLSGESYDLEDGRIDEASFHWRSNRDGELGIGSQVVVSLSEGKHLITLTATDSDGNTATATAIIFVGHRSFLPLSKK